MVIAIHNEVLSKYHDVLKNSGLEASFVEIEIFSSIRAVLGNDLRTIAVFDFGASTTKIYIVERGIVRSSHSINRGSQDITIALSASLGISMSEAENIKRNFGTSGIEPAREKEIFGVISLAMDYIFSEVSRTLVNYEQRYHKNISKIVLTGGGVGGSGFIELAKASLSNEVELGDPFSRVEFPAFLQDVLRVNGPEFSVAVGAALRRLQEEG